MNRRGALAALAGFAALAVLGPVRAQTGPDIVLPAEFANRVRMTFQQAGRNIEIWVVNPNTPWVITSITARLEYKAVPRKNAQPPGRGPISDFYPAPEMRSWPVNILPDETAKLSMRLGDDSVLESIHPHEVRGRERTLLEELRRYF
jgi:hypothetical protein